jgi:hypothetical protein
MLSAPSVPGLSIVEVHFDGTGRTEPDEYVVIRNLSQQPASLAGWKLADISDGRPSYVFSGGVLGSGQELRVYTNEVHQESGGHSFGFGSAIWNNCEPDTAGLFDPSGKLVSQLSYQKASGC